jgi:hypothetical protein
MCYFVLLGAPCHRNKTMTSISPSSAFALVLLVFIVITTFCCLVGRTQRHRIIKNQAIYLKTWGPTEYVRYYKQEPEDAVYAASNDVVLGKDRHDPDLDRKAGLGPNAGKGDEGGISRLPAIIAI